MVVVVDYDAGNLYNVANALRHLGADFVMSGEPDVVSAASRVILPGVGSAQAAMRSLQRQGLVPVLRNLRVPFLGICLGLQLLFELSEEDSTPCLGIIPGRVCRFSDERVKVPQIGWNRVEWNPTSFPAVFRPVLDGLPRAGYFYFVHSYFAPLSEATVGRADYDVEFSAAVAVGNYLGVQFHPERSAELGLQLLAAFINRTDTPETGAEAC